MYRVWPIRVYVYTFASQTEITLSKNRRVPSGGCGGTNVSDVWFGHEVGGERTTRIPARIRVMDKFNFTDDIDYYIILYASYTNNNIINFM